MKVVFCRTCEDVFTPLLVKTVCSCEKTAAIYDEEADLLLVTDNGVVFGIDQESIRRAIATADSAQHGGEIVHMFLIYKASTVLKVENLD